MALSLDAVTVDMTHMTSLKELPDGFMRGCTSLTSIKLPPNVEELGIYVLSFCTQLTSLDMSSLTGVKELPGGFMSGCIGLTSIMLPPNVEELGDGVLSFCTQLTSLDMSLLTCVKKLPHNFMLGCTSLTSITVTGCNDFLSREMSERFPEIDIEEKATR